MIIHRTRSHKEYISKGLGLLGSGKNPSLEQTCLERAEILHVNGYRSFGFCAVT